MAIAIQPVAVGSPPQPETDMGRPFHCTQPDCDKSYTRAWLLRKHVKAEHEGIRFPCPDCELVFKYDNDLRQHQLRIHQGKRPYICKADGHDGSNSCACGQRFATSSELYRHRRSNVAKVRAKAKARRRRTKDILSLTRAMHNPAHVGEHGALLPHQQSIVLSSMRFGSTASFERALTSIRNYIFGSFEAGTWVPNETKTYCESTKDPRVDRLLEITDQVLGAKMALDSGDFSAATFAFSQVCRSAKTVLKAEQFGLLDDLIDTSLRFSHSASGDGIKRLRASLDMVGRHFTEMASVVHGPEHPLAIILKALHKHTSDEEVDTSYLALLKALFHCYEQVLGPHGSHCISLKLGIIKCERNFSPSKLWNLLESCDQACGFDSIQSFRCLDSLAHWHRESRDLAGMAKMLKCIEQRMATIENPAMLERYTMASSRLKLHHCWFTGEWDQAVEVLESELVPYYEMSFGKSSPSIVSFLDNLGYCLRQTENWDRLEEVKVWRRSIIERGVAEDDDDEL